MSILNIVKIPDPVLKKKAEPVEAVTDDIRKQIDDMFETMYEAPGIGLAANQIGKLNRVLVMHVKYDDVDTGPIAMINSEKIWESAEYVDSEEGCLSIPGQYATVQRPKSVKVRYLNISGQEEEYETSDLPAICISHEMDHLNGILFIDHLSGLKRDMIIKKFLKQHKQS